MAEEGDKQSLLEGAQPHKPPYNSNNDVDTALFHEKGKSPKEVCIGDIAFCTTRVSDPAKLSSQNPSLVVV